MISNRCTKAIIPVAGFGTRRLPITKAIEKCMLPIGNRPVIDYVVQDCLKAGITDIIFVVSEDFEQLRRYYGRNAALEEHLQQKGQGELAAKLEHMAHQARFHYVVQDSTQPYGTSVPLYLARNFIDKDEQFIVVFGDQVYYHADGGSELADFLQRVQKLQAPAAMLAVEVPLEETPKYGIIATRPHPEQQGSLLYDYIVERPATPAEAPSRLNNGSLYTFNTDILPYVVANVEAVVAGEHYLIDALNAYVTAGHEIAVLPARGEYLDCGTVEGWLHANNRVLGA